MPKVPNDPHACNDDYNRGGAAHMEPQACVACKSAYSYCEQQSNQRPSRKTSRLLEFRIKHRVLPLLAKGYPAKWAVGDSADQDEGNYKGPVK
jgi:hypothetical protein